jgi:hypothetical protein
VFNATFTGDELAWDHENDAARITQDKKISCSDAIPTVRQGCWICSACKGSLGY